MTCDTGCSRYNLCGKCGQLTHLDTNTQWSYCPSAVCRYRSLKVVLKGAFVGGTSKGSARGVNAPAGWLAVCIVDFPISPPLAIDTHPVSLVNVALTGKCGNSSFPGRRWQHGNDARIRVHPGRLTTNSAELIYLPSGNLPGSHLAQFLISDLPCHMKMGHLITRRGSER